MQDVLVLQHDPAEGMGTFAEVVESKGVSFRHIQLFEGEQPPEDCTQARALILLGGPMSSREEDRYPYLKWEKILIKEALRSGTPLLGIMLGRAVNRGRCRGGSFPGKSPRKRMVSHLIDHQRTVDPLLGRLPEKPMVFQWYRRGFELPPGARRLACSAADPNQAFRLGRNTYGLQFHLEVTPMMVEQWMRLRRQELPGMGHFVPAKILADTRSYAGALRRCGERFFAEFLGRTAAARVLGGKTVKPSL